MLRPNPRRVCLVVDQDPGLIAPLLRYAPDAQAHVLHDSKTLTGFFDHPAGLEFHSLRQIPVPPEIRVEGPNQAEWMLRSDRLRWALQELHGRFHFEEIVFPSRGGLAFRTVQAQRMGVGFSGVRVSIFSNGTSKEERSQAGRRAAGWKEWCLDFAEEYVNEEVPSPRADAGGLENNGPRVTVGVAHYNLGRYLPLALESLAQQTYRNLEVIVIDDGSTEPESRAVFDALERTYPSFRFLRQNNAGIGAVKNRAWREGTGSYFLPMDADNLAHPEMLARFVHALETNPGLAAVSSYFLAFSDEAELEQKKFAYSYRPVGGPIRAGAVKNIFGDGNALFRVQALHAVGGFETDRQTSFEDWELFAKLAHAGYRLDVVPAFLFFYRHLPGGFSRATRAYQNHDRVLRQYRGRSDELLWDALLGLQDEVDRLENENAALKTVLGSTRFRWTERLWKMMKPFLRPTSPPPAPLKK